MVPKQQRDLLVVGTRRVLVFHGLRDPGSHPDGDRSTTTRPADPAARGPAIGAAVADATAAASIVQEAVAASAHAELMTAQDLHHSCG